MNAYVLLHEIVGGEEEDHNFSDIVAIMVDVAVLSDRIPVHKFRCVDPEYITEHESEIFYPNPVERYVIRRFDLETGNEVDDTSAIFWSVDDFWAVGLDIFG